MTDIKLEDLLVEFKNYNARKIKGEIIVRVNKNGLYRARNAQDVKTILTNGKSLLQVFVRLHKKSDNWTEIKPN